MEELKLGPNGGLLYCMEYIIENKDWLHDQLSDLSNDDYVLFDCPGQIELYTHLDLMHSLCAMLQEIGFTLCSVYMLDTTFIQDNIKFVSGVLMALCSMVNLNLPHLTILTKCDLVGNKDYIDKYINYADDIGDIDVVNNEADSDDDQQAYLESQHSQTQVALLSKDNKEEKKGGESSGVPEKTKIELEKKTETSEKVQHTWTQSDLL